MSPASYLAAPPRVAASQYSHHRAGYDPAMPSWTWAGLAVFVAALGVAGAAALWRMVALARASRSLQTKLEPLSARLTETAEELDRKNLRFAAGQEQAKLSIGRLRGSVAQLQVLVAALEEIRLALRLLRLVRTGR